MGMSEEASRLNNELTKLLGRPSLGSKSMYHESHPQGIPIFNATIMYQDSQGELRKFFHCDLEMADSAILETLAQFSKSQEINLFIYRESTVNNSTFNGRRFPYEWFEYSVTPYQGVIENVAYTKRNE